MPSAAHARSLSVVIPAYNEEACIERCVVQLETALAGIVPDFELLVVDDGSTDGTAAILQRLTRACPRLAVVTHDRNQGLGRTLRSGFARCRKEITFYCDADLPVDFTEVSRALRVMELKDADIVAGFRHDRTSEGSRRVLYSFLYNWLIRLVFGLRMKDVNFSFKLIRTRWLPAMDLRSDGSFIDAEIMIKADRMQLFVCQIGLDYFKRAGGDSHLFNSKAILKILREMIREYPALKRVGRPRG